MQKPRYIVQYWENNNWVKIACKTKQEANELLALAQLCDDVDSSFIEDNASGIRYRKQI